MIERAAIDEPVASTDQVLIDVHAVGLNSPGVGIDTTRGAGMLLTYGTAYHAPADRAAPRTGEHVSLTGAGGGGVGAVGIAKALGAHVVGSAAGEA